MEDFKIGQLTKELVVARLRKMTDPGAAAAEVVKKTLAVTLKSTPPAESAQVIADGCKGGITGLLLADQDLARGAVLLLQAVSELAGESGLDPQEAMLAALRGFSDMRRFLRADQLSQMENELEARFHGAGNAFAEALVESRRTEKTPAA